MRLLFHPSPPRPINKITDICKRLQITPVTGKSTFDKAIHWSYETFCRPDNYLRGIHLKHGVINFGITDVSKSRVDHVFKSVFGYSSLVNPDTFPGHFIQKSELQAEHDATIVAPQAEYDWPGFIYQKLLDSRVSFDQTMDIRVPVFKDEIPFVFFKFRNITDPVHVLRSVSFTIDPKEVFSPKELNLILKFAEKFGLDFGEIDLIRNNSDGKLYILDVNNIAGNRLFQFLPDEKELIQSHYAELFKQKFLS